MESHRVAFISGGTSGINLAVADLIVRRGGKVLVFGRDAEKARAAADGLASERPDAVAWGAADVRDPEAIGALFARTVESLGRPNLIIAGAAGNFMAPAVRISPNGFKAVVDIDLLGTYNVFKAGFDVIARPGSMIAITAPQADRPMPQQVHVCAAKAGVNMVVRVLAMEWGAAGIRVNAVSPGPISGTEGVLRMAPDESTQRAWNEQIALHRFGQGEDVAEAVLFLASTAADYITGTVLDCDGGMKLGNASGNWLD